MTNSFSTANTVADKVSLTINAWKSKLLDLTKRNRALNYKPNKVTTVAIVDEQAAEIFRLLCLTGKSLKFKPALEKKKDQTETTSVQAAQTTSDNTGLLAEEDFETSLPAPDFVPYNTAGLADQYTDDYLQTSVAPEILDKSLRRLEEQARLAIEEQGVNSLFLALGMLHYKESGNSDEVYKAPLVLIPVELARKSARSGYTIKITDDETIVNPSLTEHLRRNHGIALPEIPDSAALSENYDLQRFFAEVCDAVQHQAGWTVKNEIHLALFSFQKLVMYKDLERNQENLAAHSIINRIITRNGDNFVGLPDDVRTVELDREFAPETTAQVVDADSSQLRAIAAVARNHNLVLEGPPGTGKSQTITNLIAQTLSAGKSILFVAEKQAALNVVHNRLVKAGLGEFCLEMHATKANKRAVMQEIRQALDASLQGVAVPQASSQRLPVVREQLTAYARAVHAPYGALNSSPYRIYGEVGAVLTAPKVALRTDIFSVAQSNFNDALREIEDLTVAAEAVGSPAKHPWRETRRTFYSEDDLDQIAIIGAKLRNQLNEAQELARKIEASFGLPPIKTFADVETAIGIATVIARSPGAPMQVLGNEAWNTAPPEAKDLIERGRRTVALREKAEQNFSPAAFDQDPTEDIAFIEQKSIGLFSFFAFFNGRYRSVKKSWLSYRLPSYQATLTEQGNDLKTIAEYLREQKELRAQSAKGSDFFGALWQGEQSNWSALENYIAWVLDFRRLCVSHGLREQALATASRSAPDVTAVQLLEKQIVEIRKLLNELCLAVDLPNGYFDRQAFAEVAVRVVELIDNSSLAARWAAFEAVRQRVEQNIAAELLPLVMTEQLAFADSAAAFKRAFYQKWLGRVVQERTELREFHTLTHEQRVREFQELDERVLTENRAALVGRLRERLQNSLREPKVQDAMKFLRRELARQRGLSPLRVTMKNALPAIRVIKPCFLMSPQTVAQFLDDPTTKFDLVIFDEASQLPTEDAVGTILRGHQLVVVGDPKQLPPTNFFAVQSGTASAPIGEDGLPLYEDSQSILEEVMGAGVPQSRLKWHYRSAHESLITFSNVSFYDADLYTFPSVETDSADSGLQFEYVENGIYEGKGLNLAEARRVADAVVEHARTKPDVSLGIGTFNLRQQLAIQDELEQRRRQEPSIESFFNKSNAEPFFVKNLENIQGDERDAIFLSVTYAKSADGKMRYNLGPLNGENGWRRLNVLTTRAKKLMRVFSSIHSDEINPVATSSRGAQLLKDFLTYAEHKRLDSPILSAAAETESPFEREVYQELQKRDINLVPQVGVCGYRIDLGVLDREAAGRFVCGIECDGVAYHSSESARDRDRLRQQVLEGRGWEIHRVWSTDWFKDRQGQIERLLNMIEQSRQRARKEAEAEQERERRVKDEFDKQTREFLGEISNNETIAGSSEPTVQTYVRPVAEPYRFADSSAVFAAQYLVEAPTASVAAAILKVVEAEAPIHLKDLTARVAAMWGQKSGSNISARVAEVVELLRQTNRLQLRGDFIWKTNGDLVVRSRNNTNILAERIAPEEVQAAVMQVLRAGRGFTRQELVNEVRAVFGFTRTGTALQQTIESAIEKLLAKNEIGEGSLGIAARING